MIVFSYVCMQLFFLVGVCVPLKRGGPWPLWPSPILPMQRISSIPFTLSWMSFYHPVIKHRSPLVPSRLSAVPPATLAPPPLPTCPTPHLPLAAPFFYLQRWPWTLSVKSLYHRSDPDWCPCRHPACRHSYSGDGNMGPAWGGLSTPSVKKSLN